MKDIDVKYSNKAIDYNDSLKFMETRVSDIISKKKKELIWFLYHDHIYTMGTSGNEKEIHSKINIPLIKTNRGGKVTYHGPGQQIVYFLINLQNRKKDVRKFINVIENSAIKLLKEFNIEAKTFPNRVGIWITKNGKDKLIEEQKIGAIGLRIKKWVTYHGLSFNLNPNLNYYNKIHACGLKEYKLTSMESLGRNLTQKEFNKMYLKIFFDELKKI